jgi:RHS repeat-associated protein
LHFVCPFEYYPNGDDHAYTYDTLGRMATHTTPKNETCTYTYDVRDRQTKRDWNSTTPDTETEYFADGNVKSIDNGSTLVSYTYDTLGRMDTETQTFTGRPARTVAYEYDADGLRSDLTHPSGKAVDYQWTAKGQLDNLAADGPPPLAEYTYDKAGRLDLLEHENGITEDLGYDAASQLQTRLHKLGATTVSGHGYDYDATSRRTDETFADGSTAARTYGYDTADQVTSANYGAGLTDSYTYDAAANRSGASVAALGGSATTYTTNSANQYTSISGMPAPVHDANGNLTSQNGNTYIWDSENRLLGVTPNTPAIGEKSLAYIYDAHHRRTIRNIQEWNGNTWGLIESTRFIYDGWNVIAEYALTSTTETLIRERTWGTDLSGSLQGAGGVGGLLMVEEIGTTTSAYHYQYDGNGNVTEITDHTGAKVATYRYDAFGNTLVATGSYAATNRYRFSTKPLDNEIASAPLYYYGYRYYDPVTGRWPSRDPIGEEGGINLYGFVGNNGVNRWDRLGLQADLPENIEFPDIPEFDPENPNNDFPLPLPEPNQNQEPLEPLPPGADLPDFPAPPCNAPFCLFPPLPEQQLVAVCFGILSGATNEVCLYDGKCAFINLKLLPGIFFRPDTYPRFQAELPNMRLDENCCPKTAIWFE